MCLKAPLYQLRSNRDINNCIISVEMTPWYQQLHDISSRYGGWIAKIKTGKIHYDTQSCGKSPMLLYAGFFIFRVTVKSGRRAQPLLFQTLVGASRLQSRQSMFLVPGSRWAVGSVLSYRRTNAGSWAALLWTFWYSCMHACLHFFHACIHACFHASSYLHKCLTACMHSCLPSCMHACLTVHVGMHVCR